MKTIITLAVVIGIFAALELYFGIDDTGGKIALVMLVWSCISIPVTLSIDCIIVAIQTMRDSY